MPNLFDTRGDQAPDARLRSVKHFDVHPPSHRHVPFPPCTRWDGRRAWVEGQLTIVGVTNTIELHVTYRGTVIDP